VFYSGSPTIGQKWIKITANGIDYYATAEWTGSAWNGSIGPSPECNGFSTQICSFSPEDGYVATTTQVDFDLHAYINSEDVSDIKGIKVTLHNIDQNVLLLGFLSPSDIILVDENIDIYDTWVKLSNTKATLIGVANPKYTKNIIICASFHAG